MVNDISEYIACESIVNLSDHLPVACNLAVPVQMIDTKSIHDTKSTHEQKGRRNNGSRRWDKGDLALYYNVSYEHLSKIHVRYDTRCYFNVRSKADISQFNLPHGNDN